MGPLDVINPLDASEIYTEMADNTDMMNVKIARPMIHASARFGQFSKLEGVFALNFEPHRLARDGRWAPAQMVFLNQLLPAGNIITPDTTTLDYAQTGARFTTTIGSSDLGAQYYYGRLPEPAVDVWLDLSSGMPVIKGEFLYNPYHQIGFDYAQVIYGFNVRAELAANITEDLEGDDGSVYNPSLAWSLGFDRDLAAGINLNFQINEKVRLLHDEIGGLDLINGDFDIESGRALTDSRITAAFSKKFLRDELELRAALVWGVEDEDCLVMPALIWSKDDLRIACSGGIFAGNEDGQLGCYRKNNFVKIVVTYRF
jgi:hypothetical protein